MKIEKSTGMPNRRANPARTTSRLKNHWGSWEINQTEAKCFKFFAGQLVLTITGQGWRNISSILPLPLTVAVRSPISFSQVFCSQANWIFLTPPKIWTPLCNGFFALLKRVLSVWIAKNTTPLIRSFRVHISQCLSPIDASLFGPQLTNDFK